MADKIDNINGYDIDLPPDATPSIASLTAESIIVQDGTTFVSIDKNSIQFVDSQIVGYVAMHRNNIVINSGALGSTTLTYPTGADGIFATQEWVTSQGYTSNAGTVTSVRVQAGTGLSSSQSTAQTSTLNTTISIASGYKLPTTTEWNNKSGKLYHHTLHLRINYQVFAYAFDSTSNASTTLATLASKLNLNPSVILASEYVTGDAIHIQTASYQKGTSAASIQSGDWYSKNGSNYMVRSSAYGYSITIESESITEA